MSQDKGKLTSQGNNLLNLCKTHNMYILNCRIGNDMNIGKHTYKDCGFVDYAIETHHIFEKVKHFQVCDFKPLFSDVHCAIIVGLDCFVPVIEGDKDMLINKKTFLGKKNKKNKKNNNVNYHRISLLNFVIILI